MSNTEHPIPKCKTYTTIHAANLTHISANFLRLLLACTLFSTASIAQSPPLPYNGLRVALFDFKILKIRGNSVSLKCRVANTGREEVGAKKTVVETLIELDTANLPALLWGHESDLSDAVRSQLPRIDPGEISSPIWLKFAVRAPPAAVVGSCPDLVLDTAYLSTYSDAEIVLRYILRNIGSAPVEVAGAGVSFGLNIYFISGNKLTRGAIPAGNTTIILGRETLTGWLEPGQKLRGEAVINIKNRTKFARNLMLELAPPSNMQECDRTNNTRSVELKY